MQVCVRILDNGRIEVSNDNYPVQFVVPGGKRFGVTYDQYRAHGDGPMEVPGGGVVDVTELHEGQAFQIIGGLPLSGVLKPR